MIIHENQSIKLNFYGVAHPIKEEQVVPTLQNVLDNTISKLKTKLEDDMKFIDLNETIGFLEMLRNLTVPEKGYIFCPDERNEETKGILTKYGQKILKEQKND